MNKSCVDYNFIGVTFIHEIIEFKFAVSILKTKNTIKDSEYRPLNFELKM